MTTWYNKAIENLSYLFLLDLFRAGLPHELRQVINIQNMGTLTLDMAVTLAMTETQMDELAQCAAYPAPKGTFPPQQFWLPLPKWGLCSKTRNV